MDRSERTAKARAIETIYRDIENCAERCRVEGIGITPVYSRGNPGARSMLIGEGPGEQEERAQRPFVGAAGRLLDETLQKLGFDVNRDFYITNIVKRRSFKVAASGKKENKPPTMKQIKIEKEFLEREIEVIEPRLIVALGAKASQWLLGKDFRLTQNHGNFYGWNGIEVLPTFHPAAVLRALGIDDETRKHEFTADLSKIRDILKPRRAA